MNPYKNKFRGHLFHITALLFFTSTALFAQVDYEENLNGIEYDVGFLLTWTTSSEDNNQLFTIERSIDGGEFENIGSVESKYDNSSTAYRYIDLELGLKNVSYRLKQVSKDGGYSFSDQINLEKEFVSYFRVAKKEKITDELFQVSVNSIKSGELEYRLINDIGDIIIEELKPLKEGLNDYVLDLQSEVDGDYNLVFKLDAELESVYFKKETKDKKGNVANKKPASSGGG